MEAQILHRARIMVVDDDADSTRLLKDILTWDGYSAILCSTNPSQAVELAKEFHPDIIILDLHMPGMDGFEVMQQVIQNESPDTFLPILVVSGDYSPEVKQRALSSGAKDFLRRPYDVIEIKLRIQNLLEARFLQLDLKRHNEQLEERVSERTQELELAHLDVKEAQIELIARLALASELHDDDTGQHTQRVSLISFLIAQNLGLPPSYAELIRSAAPMHDVGKIGVPDSILLKQGPLSDEEFETVKRHCRIGAHVLADGHAELVQMAESIALCHHERWDGNGYPQKLHGEAIPLEARILSVADVFDALTHERPYKKAWPVAQAVAEIARQSGRQFDPAVVEAFLTLPHADLL